MTILSGFTNGDTPKNGMSVVVSSRAGKAKAREVARDIATVCWADRQRYVPEMKAAGGNAPSFPAVQCEACHGPGATHVAQARAKVIDRAALIGRPDEASCVRCHNSGSPHFKSFFYGAMKGLVHLVKK